METWLSKLLTMIILGVSVFLVGVSTIKLRKVLGIHAAEVRRSQVMITSVLLCFGAGVLLATCMLHILPEAREGMLEAQERLGVEYLGELVTCAGFFLVYVVEELVHLTLHYTRHREQFHKALALRKASPQADSNCNKVVQDCCEKDIDCHNDMEVGFSSCHNDMDVEVETGYGTIKVDKKDLKTTETTAPSECQASKHAELSPLRDFLTVLALSFHATFEGLAVGLEKESQDVWAMFTAIATHKLVITFCLSLEMLNTVPTMLAFFSYLITFSIVSPLGIGLGMIISQAGSVDGLTVSVLQALAGGTLLYVVMFEVLQREKEKDVSGALQLVGILLGFSFMTMLQTLAGEDHEEGEDNEGKSKLLVNILQFRLLNSHS